MMSIVSRIDCLSISTNSNQVGLNQKPLIATPCVGKTRALGLYQSNISNYLKITKI